MPFVHEQYPALLYEMASILNSVLPEVTKRRAESMAQGGFLRFSRTHEVMHETPRLELSFCSPSYHGHFIAKQVSHENDYIMLYYSLL